MTAIERAWRGGKSDWKLHLLSVFSVAVAFVCLASALLVVNTVTDLRDRWVHAGRASVYLQIGSAPKAIEELQQALQGTPGVAAVRYVSSDEARREVLGNSRDQLLSALPAEAFPASLEIDFTAEGSSRLSDLAAQLALLPAVETVETYQDWGARLDALLGGGLIASLVLAMVVLAAVVSVVGSTIRLSLERRHVEVEVLRVIGATDTYVRRPFLIEGAAQGGIGALFALLVLGVLYTIVRLNFHGELATLVGVAPTFLPWQWALSMVALGTVLGVAAAYLSLRKRLTL